MKKLTYAQTIPNLTIDGKPAPYQVVNERSIRAVAGMMLIIGLSTFWYIWGTRDYTPLPYVVILFWLEFFLKTVFSARWSLFGPIANWIVNKQKPEYVGAIQKRFAWALGLFMASSMMIVAVFMGIKGIAPMAICMTCLFFMWLETSCGICVGCKIYSWLLKKNIIPTPKHKPACPGGACSVSFGKK